MCCVRLWAASATTSGTLLSRPEWLQVALSLLLDKASVDDPDTDATILAALDEFTSEDLPLSLLTPVSPNFRA